MSLILRDILISVSVSVGIWLGYFWWNSQFASKHYPILTLDVPDNAEQDFLFRAWCDANRFIRQPDGVYRRKDGWFIGTTEIHFENNQMHIQEVVHFFFMKYKFALNAPIMLLRAIRLHKIKQLNKLIKHWQIESVSMLD